MTLPDDWYSVEQVRGFDAQAIATQGVSGYALMQRAGEAALRVLRDAWPEARRVAVVCGGGNNGGDGYVLARLLRAAGLNVTVQALKPTAGLRGDAQQAFADFAAQGGVAEEWVDDAESAIAAPAKWRLQWAMCEVLVDALLGTGFHAPLRAPLTTVIAAINGSGRPVLALDIPSGLDGDTGLATDGAVNATHTITFVALKQGLQLASGPDYCGELHWDALDVQLPDVQQAVPRWTSLGVSDLQAALPPRARDANKGNFGHVLIIGGGPGMAGAVRLAGEACLRVGAGLVSIATAPEHVASLAAARPELMCLGVRVPADLDTVMARATVVAIGPGLGQSDWSRALWLLALGCGKPLVVDADALNLFAAAAGTAPGMNRRAAFRVLPARSILTPHPGEAARLLRCSTAEVQQDRRRALEHLCELTAGVVVLKGSGSLVGEAGWVPGLCTAGNPGMASGGMGDVLTGAIAGILAQCRDPWLAARAGVWAHAEAGDRLAQRCGARGLLALDLAAELTVQVNSGA